MIVCSYCGEPADTIDHVVPRAILRSLADDPEALNTLKARGRILEVDACRECNNLLSSDYDATLAARKERLRKKLRSRHSRLLSLPDWTDSELGQLGPRLQQKVIFGIVQRDWIAARLRYEGPATKNGVRLRGHERWAA